LAQEELEVSTRFVRAIVRPPPPDFAEGLTTVDLGPPSYRLAFKQHEQYCRALERCGLALERLEPDPRYPDSTFVEDIAVLTSRCAILTRPGAPSREGEVAGIEEVLARFYDPLLAIGSPGTLDGGDVCEASDHFFVGISARTNENGAGQLTRLLAEHGYTSSTVDIRGVSGILHLKSGLACLGQGRLVVVDALADRDCFRGYEIVTPESGEEYAANCVRVNDRVLTAAGFPSFNSRLLELGHDVVTLDLSEFQKMDGGLSCLSLRF
jgi:dimethylargininase